MDEAAISRVFRLLYLADLEGGEPRSLSEYQQLFPGHDDLIEAQMDRISLGGAESGDDATRRAGIVPITGAGDRIGRYRIQREIGRGGQAIVYLADDEKLNRQVALKVLTRLGPGSESTLARFQREAEVCSKLNHRGICTVYEADVDRGIPFIAMQFVEGDTLAGRIARTRMASVEDEDAEIFFDDSVASPGDEKDAAPPRELEIVPELPDRDGIWQIVETFEKAARALHDAHEAGVIHRDIKPGNIMITPQGDPVILDFGLAQGADDLADITQTGDFFGTPAYMSPEQISAHRIRLDRRTDVFSLAVALYEFLTGRRPFDAETRDGIYQAILTKTPEDPRRINPDVTRDLWVVLQKATEKDRDRRYATALELAEELRRVRCFEPILARPAGPLLRLLRWSQRNRGVAAMLVLLAVVIAAGTAWARFDKQREIEAAAAQSREERADAARRARQERRDRVRRAARTMDVSGIDPFTTFGQMVDVYTDLKALGDEGLTMVREELLKSDHVNERILACQLLMAYGEPGTWGQLMEVAIGDESKLVARWASQAMIRIEDPAIVPILREIADRANDAAVRVNALFGLCVNEDAEGIDRALRYVADTGTDKMYRMSLGISLFTLDHESLLPVADEFLHHAKFPNDEIREIAVGFYEKIDTPDAWRRLEALSHDEDVEEAFRKAAAEAIEERARRTRP